MFLWDWISGVLNYLGIKLMFYKIDLTFNLLIIFIRYYDLILAFFGFLKLIYLNYSLVYAIYDVIYQDFISFCFRKRHPFQIREPCLEI